MSSALPPTTPDFRDVVRRLAILAPLPEPVRELVVESFEECTYSFAELIVSAAKPVSAFFVLIEGLARVVAEDDGEVSLGLLRHGDTFGEVALSGLGTGVSSLRASGPVRAARLDGTVLRALTRLYPEIAAAFEIQAETRRAEEFSSPGPGVLRVNLS